MWTRNSNGHTVTDSTAYTVRLRVADAALGVAYLAKGQGLSTGSVSAFLGSPKAERGRVADRRIDRALPIHPSLPNVPTVADAAVACRRSRPALLLRIPAEVNKHTQRVLRLQKELQNETQHIYICLGIFFNFYFVCLRFPKIIFLASAVWCIQHAGM